LQVLAAMRLQGCSLRQLLAGLQLYPQKMINVPAPRGCRWQDYPGLVERVRVVEARMAGKGRVLLRASGTEPLLRVMVEGRERGEVEAAALELAETARQVLAAGEEGK